MGEETALRDAMLELLRDEDKRREMGAKARRRAESFRPQAIFEQWRQYLESILGA